MAQRKLKCCVQHCNIKFGDFDEERMPYKFFQFPPLRKYKNSELSKLSVQRRKAWKTALKITKPLEINKSTICSNHFINKKPALLKDKNDPDWVPNLNLERSKTVKLQIDTYENEDLSSNTSISEENIKMEQDIEMTEYKFADETLDEATLMEENFQCRLCSESIDSTKTLPLFSEETWFGMNLLKSIDYVLSLRIKHNDDLPDTICFTCATKLVEFHKFKEKCRNVYENFSKSSERRNSTEKEPNLYSNLKTLEEITDKNDTFIACRFTNTTCDIENARKFSEIQSKDKITTIITCNLRTKEDLENLIIMENKLILLKYQKYGELDGSYRENLAGLIGYTLFKKNYKERVKKETFDHIASLIVELFPNEKKETWFRLSDKVNYFGKLYNTYKNLRTKYTALKAVIPHSDDIEDTDVIRQYKNLQLKNHFGLIVNLSLKTKEDLENLILIENKAIMMKYQKDGELDSCYRDNLANVIVASLVKKNEKVQRRDFEKLAVLITKLFPNEDKDRWFALTPKTYSGKLFNTYRTYRSKYTTMGPFESFEINGMYFVPVTSGTDVLVDSVADNSLTAKKVSSTQSFYNTLETVTFVNEIAENPIEFPSEFQFDASTDPIGIKNEDVEVPKQIIHVKQNSFHEPEPEPEEDQESTSNYHNFELSSYEITELSTINSFVITHVNLDSVDGLRTIVQNENKAIMIKYQNDGELDSLYRDNLTHLLISTLLKKNYRVKICRNTFHKIAKLIPQLFPTEKRETYFGTNPKKFTGKLYNTYRTHRGKYAMLGVLKEDANNTEKDLDVDIELSDDGNRSLTSNIPIIVSCELETKDDLKNLIYIENKSILLKYKIDQQLDNMYREALTSIIILTMMKKDHVEKIPRNVLQKLSSLIVQLFPNEKEEIYFRSANRKFHGKLYSCYRTFRNKYMQLGVIKSYES